jgi:DNA-binding NarL/FixJ family response regulator
MTRVMIFEGNSTIQEFLANIVGSRFPSVELSAEADGKGAMEKVERFLPDLVLIDHSLRGDNAFYLTQNIKASHPDATVIFLCSYDIPEYREKASRHGADYFMVKDSSTADYIAMIESILSGRGGTVKKGG